MRILITGGAGFIGSNLVARIRSLSLDHDITVLDSEILGNRSVLDAFDCRFIHGDIRDAAMVRAAVDGADAVIHLAADTRVIPSIENPVFNMEVNVVGALTVLEAMRNSGVKRFVNASTGGAIVGAAEAPVHEGMVPSPLSPYGASKLAVEGYASAYEASYGMNCVSLRFSNVYGPRSFHKGSVIAAFMKNILNSRPLDIYGDGSQTRDYVYVDDLCDGIISAVGSQVSGPVQLGTGAPTALNDLVALLREATGSSVPVIHHPFRAGEVLNTWCRIDRARAVIAYDPSTELIDGLRRTWAWFCQERSRFSI
jgi:UDP-glucose 4-epimerase